MTWSTSETLVCKLTYFAWSCMGGLQHWDPFCQHRLTLIPVWISNHMPSKVWDEITCQFPNFNGSTVKVLLKFGNGKVISSHTFYWMWLLIHSNIKVNPCQLRFPYHFGRLFTPIGADPEPDSHFTKDSNCSLSSMEIPFCKHQTYDKLIGQKVCTWNNLILLTTKHNFHKNLLTSDNFLWNIKSSWIKCYTVVQFSRYCHYSTVGMRKILEQSEIKFNHR